MSVYVATIIVRKQLQLSRARKATLKFSKPFSDALANEDFNAAEDLVNKHPHSHLAAAFRRVFPSLTFHSQDMALSAVEVASVQRIIDLNTLEQLAKFRRGLGVLATVGATAPFVGLLGTTMGVVKAFQGMGSSRQLRLRCGGGRNRRGVDHDRVRSARRDPGRCGSTTTSSTASITSRWR